MAMATAIMNMSGLPLQYPSQGRLQIRMITRAMPGGVSSTLGDNCFIIYFNPLFHLSSWGSAFSFFLAAMDSRMGTDIVYRIAAFAFDQVRSRNWFYGLSLSVVLQTVYVLAEPELPRSHRAEFLDGQMILSNDDTTAVGDYYEELDDILFDLMIQPFASVVDSGNEEEDNDTIRMGMSEQEISMLKTERLRDDEEEGECCCICLEGFMRGMVITQLAPCSHRFHNACISQWLQKNQTCPICRGRCVVSVS